RTEWTLRRRARRPTRAGDRRRCSLVGSRAGMRESFDEVVASRLRRLGQRLTPRRRRLLDVLAGAAQPLTITQILGRDASLAMSSAYRNLVVLEQAGVVQRISSGEGFARFEL